MTYMGEPSIKITKMWEDVDFFELQIDFYGFSCKANIDIYTTNEDLEELIQGIINFSTFTQDEFIWTSGEDTENATHFLSMRYFKHDNRGHVGIEIVADNKMEKPYYMRSNFFIVTELNQLDDFVRKLEKLIHEEINELESIIPAFNI
jgi:hypothetical protein